jgi:hypothetical protein
VEDPNKLQRDVSVLLNEKEMVVITARDIYCALIKAGHTPDTDVVVDRAVDIVKGVSTRYAARITEAEKKFQNAMEEIQELKKKMMENMQSGGGGAGPRIVRATGCPDLGCGH